MDVGDDGRCESVSRERHEHLGSALAPRHVVLGTPARDCAEEECEVVASSQLLGWSRVAAQFHQDLHSKNTFEHLS